MTEASPFNYRYMLGFAERSGGRTLDYGCGLGAAVALGRERGLDIWGADTYQGFYKEWADCLAPGAKDRVKPIVGGKADFPDQYFDFIFCNQVLEHTPDPELLLADCSRLLRPGGYLVAAYPVTETWWEGHIGLYFAHRLRGRVRRTYFNICHRLRLGYYRENLTREKWIERSENTLDTACYYYPRELIDSAFSKYFAPTEDIALDYMRTRLATRSKYVPKLCDHLLKTIYHLRAGDIVRGRKRDHIPDRHLE